MRAIVTICRHLLLAGFIPFIMASHLSAASVAELNDETITLFQQGDMRAALDKAVEAVRLSEQNYVRDLAYATALSNLGELYRRQYNLEAAHDAFAKSIPVFEALPGGHEGRFASALNNFGLLQQDRKSFVEAAKLFNRAITMHRSASPPNWTAIALAFNNLGDLAAEQKHWADADGSYRQVFALGIQNAGAEQIAYAHAKHAFSLSEQGNENATENQYRQALDVLDKARVHIGSEARASYLVGEAEFNKGNHREALKFYRRAWDVMDALRAEDVWWRVTLLTRIGQTQRELEDWDAADESFRKGLDILEKSPPGFDALKVELAMRRATLKRERGLLAEADEQLSQVLALHGALTPNDNLRKADILNGLAMTQYLRARYTDAERNFRDALKLYEADGSGSKRNLGAISTNLAFMLADLARYSEAEPLLRRALESIPTQEIGYAFSLQHLAWVYADQGRLQDAEELFRAAKILIEEKLPNSLTLAGNMSNLAQILVMREQYPQAKELLEAALKIRRDKIGMQANAAVATTLHMLALVEQERGRFREAEAGYKEALRMRQAVLPDDHPDIAMTQNNLAGVYDSLGEAAAAQKLFKIVIDVQIKKLGANHRHVAESYFNLGWHYLSIAQYKDAHDAFKRGSAVATARLERNWGFTSPNQFGRAKDVASADGAFASQVKAAYRLAKVDPARHDALRNDSFEIAQWAEISEAASSISLASARASAASGKLAEKVRRRQDIGIYLEALDKKMVSVLGLPQDPSAVAQVTELRGTRSDLLREGDTLQTEIADSYREYDTFAAPRPLSVKEIQDFLEPDEALVFTLATPAVRGAAAETLVWTITKTNVDWASTNLGRAELADLVRALRCGLDASTWRDNGKPCETLLGVYDIPGPLDPLPFAFDIAHRLYAALFAKAKAIAAGKRLLYVPSGALRTLPPHVLVTEPTSGVRKFLDYRGVKWLGRETSITVLPSVSSLRARRKGPADEQAPLSYLGFGDPALAGNKDCLKIDVPTHCPNLGDTASLSPPKSSLLSAPRLVGLNRQVRDGATISQICPLPETALEIRCIAKDLGAPESFYLQGLLSKRVLRELNERNQLSRYRILHFATHAVLANELKSVNGETTEPALILTPGPPGSDEDGLLRASDIVQLRMNAEWVALSACNTAAGDNGTSEALAGLARAFLYAGARSLLVSHWAVNSGATVQLTTVAMSPSLYRGRPTSYADQLREAMTRLMDQSGKTEYAHPSYWAPFVIVGEQGSRQRASQ